MNKKNFKNHIPWNKGLKRPEISGNKNPMFGKVSPMKGKKLTEEAKKKISDSKKGKKREDMVGNKFSLGKIPWNKSKKGLTKSNKTSFKKGLVPWNKNKKFFAVSGENNHLWKGGITKLQEQIRKNFKYRQWHSDVFQKDNFTCQDCDKHGGDLNAHHVKEFHTIIEENNIKTAEEAENCAELWNINNGVTLCKSCHIKRHKKYSSIIK